jgi:uncharacterized protein (TIGR02118 family)
VPPPVCTSVTTLEKEHRHDGSFHRLVRDPRRPGRIRPVLPRSPHPLSHRLPGLRSYTVARDASPVRGGDPYYLIGELEWDTMDDLRAAFASPEGQAAAADAAVLAQMAPMHSMVFTPIETLAGT